MSTAALITWNVHGHPFPRESVGESIERVERCISLATAETKARGLGRVVAVFQEVPANFDQIVTSASSGEWRVLGQVEERVAIIGSASVDLKTVPIRLGAPMVGIENRGLCAELSHLLHEDVTVVGVHWLDRVNYNATVRLNKWSHFWKVVRGQWRFPSDPHFIVAGEFNDNPFDDSLVSRDHLWAIRDGADLMTRSRLTDHRPPLYNPMWRLLPEQKSPPHGTFEYLDNDESGVRWSHIDQVLTSPSLYDLIQEVVILHALGGTLIATDRGVPKSLFASDHLSVLATFEE
jgi:hypothetical protein